MRLSRIWRILQIKEVVIHRGRRPRSITPSEICKILHILRKPNSIITLLSIQNISSFSKEFRFFALCFSAQKNIAQPCPQVFSVNGSIICSGLHFWRHFGVIGSIIFGGLHFWRHWFNMVKILYGGFMKEKPNILRPSLKMTILQPCWPRQGHWTQHQVGSVWYFSEGQNRLSFFPNLVNSSWLW